MKNILISLIVIFAVLSGNASYASRGFNQGIESEGNSTTTPLASGATFTGTGEKNGFAQVGCMAKTDNTGTMFFDFSNDGTNWDSTFPVADTDQNNTIITLRFSLIEYQIN